MNNRLTKGVKVVKFKIPAALITITAILVLTLGLMGCQAASKTSATTATNSNEGVFTIQIIEPEDNAVSSESTITVKGRTSPEAVVSIGDYVLIADAEGNFSANIALEEGPNVLDIIASDNNGNEAEINLVVSYIVGG